MGKGPTLELVEAVEDVREDEVEQRPELHEIVLQWCAGQEQSVLCMQHAQLLDETTLKVLESMGLVDHQILPLASHMRREWTERRSAGYSVLLKEAAIVDGDIEARHDHWHGRAVAARHSPALAALLLVR